MTESNLRRRIALLTLTGILWALPSAARESGEPQRFHVVYSGQRLTSIAKRYKVSVEAIRTANGLAKNARLKPGEKLTIPGLDDPDGTRARTLYPPQRPSDAVVPASTRSDKDEKDQDTDRDSDSDDGPRTHKVYSGQRLESIAKRYQITVDALCAANGITRRVTLRAGQLLLVPRPGDSIASLEAEASGRHGKLPHVGLRKGYLDLFTYSEHFRGYALDKKGKVTPTAQTEVAKLFGATGSRPATDPRLIRLLAKVSDKFGSRPMRIVSGYRTRSFFEDSRHKLSRAVDFSIPGVDNVTLRDYLRTLTSVGVGYYPNSSFVHLDVRDTNTYWVDYAGPGEAPRKTNSRDRDHDHNHDQEAEGDLQDPEVSEGDRPSVSAAPTLATPYPTLSAPTGLPSPSEAPSVKPAPIDF
ncbi:MAG TPA: LysM peptidoglycan-binding domain-containing protein [Polyangiaceae bacterium]|nr:LysM peptidoglycan-binding domain-containing protein [Polyangiaceae bacterium]